MHDIFFQQEKKKKNSNEVICIFGAFKATGDTTLHNTAKTLH